jgi:hypothetical protein
MWCCCEKAGDGVGRVNGDLLLDLRRMKLADEIGHWARRTGLAPPIKLVLAGRPKHDGRAGRSKAGD